MFMERLEKVAQKIDGVHALAIVAADGMPVESVIRNKELDLEVLSAEIMAQVRAVSQSQQELAAGPVRHLSVTTDRMVLMVNAVSPEYYVLLAMQVSGGVSRARFELRRSALLFEKDLL